MSRGRPVTRGTAWEEMTERTCRQLGGFDPDVRHRANDSVVCVRVVAHGLAVTLLPDLAPGDHPDVVRRDFAEGSVHRTIFAATRTADASRPSVQALLAAVRAAAAGVGWPVEGGQPDAAAPGPPRSP